MIERKNLIHSNLLEINDTGKKRKEKKRYRLMGREKKKGWEKINEEAGIERGSHWSARLDRNAFEEGRFNRNRFCGRWKPIWRTTTHCQWLFMATYNWPRPRDFVRYPPERERTERKPQCRPTGVEYAFITRVHRIDPFLPSILYSSPLDYSFY